ncbi:hypothetical protein [Georgenia alba]|uniref:Tetratricopeptide repeat protein n=1 Tax=Georgenia alba TaxID=2233858 RepID=A0ABW2QG80_9MICO
MAEDAGREQRPQRRSGGDRRKTPGSGRPSGPAGKRQPSGRQRGGGAGRRTAPDQPRGQGRAGGAGSPRAERRDRPAEPDLPEEVQAGMLDRGARARLRTLGKTNADIAARHLVMAGRLIDEDPEVAYRHAQAAQRRAGRVDVVREALALTAYATGRYAEALRELRTVRRLSGIDAHRPIEADCERGLGRPERALAVVAEARTAGLAPADRVELAIVASGARADLGEHEAGLLALEGPLVRDVTDAGLRRRLDAVRADRLEELGRTGEAESIRDALGPDPDDLEEEDVRLLEVSDEDETAAPDRQPDA